MTAATPRPNSATRWNIWYFVVILSISPAFAYSQASFAKMSKLRVKPKSTPSPPAQAAAVLAISLAAPTITNFHPTAAGVGTPIFINGTNFDNNTKVTFGGTPAARVTALSATQLKAWVGIGSSGSITVANNVGSATAVNFVFASLPTITQVSHTQSGDKTSVTVTGTNFIDFADVSVNNGNTITGLIISPTTIMFEVPEGSSIMGVAITTAGGVANYPTAPTTQANADLNLPDFGNGLILIPTPSFDYDQYGRGKNYSFSEKLWGNVLPTDSTRQKLGADFLAPQISLVGIKGEYDLRLSPTSWSSSLGVAMELNCVLKKVSYYDATTQTTTNFNPFVIHPRIGLEGSFLEDNVFAAVYCNFLSVVGSNDQFATFFDTPRKNVFVFPEVDIGGIVTMGTSGNQGIKFELNTIVNNGDAQFITASHDKIVPYLKIGFVTTL